MTLYDFDHFDNLIGSNPLKDNKLSLFKKMEKIIMHFMFIKIKNAISLIPLYHRAVNWPNI